jgi:hypothetical protein
MTRQTELMREAFEAWQASVSEWSAVARRDGAETDRARQKAIEKALSNMRELAEMASSRNPMRPT